MSIEVSGRRRPQFQLKDRLRLSRELQGLEQEELAERLDVSRATVSNYERGVTAPKRLVLNEWAMATGVDRDWLEFGEEGKPGPDGGQAHPKLRKVSNLQASDYKADGSTVVRLFPGHSELAPAAAAA